MLSHSVDFFDRQFARQIGAADYALNPFEQAILPYVHGEVLDLGCGLGNLALAAAQAGCQVTALDASPAAIADLQRRAGVLGAPLRAAAADLRGYRALRQYDTVVSIGLLMFFPCPQARAVLEQIRASVRPGGSAAVNVLVEGTTYMAMFDPAGYCLFARDELEASFEDWEVLLSRHEDFPAPADTRKRFHTLIARRQVRR